jgi:hypothetical protein
MESPERSDVLAELSNAWEQMRDVDIISASCLKRMPAETEITRARETAYDHANKKQYSRLKKKRKSSRVEPIKTVRICHQQKKKKSCGTVT